MYQKMTRVLQCILLLGVALLRETSSHVALTFPRARKYDLDFLDNARTPGPCGMPRGDVKTSFLSGSSFNVTWHLAYAHRGGFRLQILDALDRPLVDLTPVTQQSEFVEDDATAQRFPVELPQNFTCKDCTIRLLREADEWGSTYRFWSCADIDILERKAYREQCSGHGTYLLGRCRCDRLYHGTRCEYKEECLDNSDCGTQGTCVDNQGTTSPTKLCYCNAGWFGPGCSKRSAVKNADIDFDAYTMKQFSDDFTFYWRILKDSAELEGVIVVNGTSWVGVGWRPSTLTAACRSFPVIRDPPSEPLPQPEPKSEPEPEPESHHAPASEPEPEPAASVAGTTLESDRTKSAAKRRSPAMETDVIPADMGVTVQTSVTYRVSTKQGRKKRAAAGTSATPEPTAPVPTAVHKYTPKHDFNPMDCTDIIIGTARGNTHRVGDYYTRDRSTPRQDSFWGGKDSLTSAFGFEKDGRTTIVFRRKLTTNDVTDHEIIDGNMQVIWAKGQMPGKYIHNPPSGVEKSKVSVPQFYKTDELKYHGHKSQRGVATFNFFEEKKKESGGQTPLQGGGCGGEWRYPRKCSVENDTCEYSVQWIYKSKNDQLSFTIKSNHTDKWTGIGFSNDQKMSQTDAVLGWVDKTGRPFVMDIWLSGYSPPLLDASQDIYNASGYIKDGITTLQFSRKRITKDNRDLSFTDDHCLYMMFPIKGGVFYEVNKKIRKHETVPIVSTDRICIRSCGPEDEENEISASAPPRLFYEVEVKLVNLGDGFQTPAPESPDFQEISNTIANSFGPSLSNKLPGYYGLELNKLEKNNDDNGVIAKMNLILDKNEAKGRALKPEDTDAVAEGAFREALSSGRVGSLTVDPQYLVIRAPKVNDADVRDDEDDLTSPSSTGVLLSATKLYIVVGCVAALVALALLQASCTLYRASKRRTTKAKRSLQDQLIAKNAWRDYSSGANTNYAFEAFETEEKAPPPVSSLPRPRDVPDGHRVALSGTAGGVAPGPRATYSLPRAPGPRQPPPPQPGYYTQDRRNQRFKGSNTSASGQPQPDFYFMPSQRKYSGEVVRVYVDYGNQPK
ncbi:uncharacterized protein LOC107264912 isoform X5 [Cephus cinctus]|uniref:Uncharacterized protein LOC107264912 isoform X5 n=1 Tax=Cephus cinctus TaxID=211228 RepID=A0AAJ7BLN4_CEPCN|nr:uncharacterized protein LOC107264912 isoform X5 [Cephus cinctus]